MIHDPNTINDEATGLERVTTALRHTPSIRHDAADRIVAAALAAQHARRHRTGTWFARAAAVLLAASAGAGGLWYVQRDELAAGAAQLGASSRVPTSGAGGAAQQEGTSFASAQGGEDAPVSMPFALKRPNARSVSLVGDFDEWSPAAVPMTRDSTGTWTATIALAPGRHAYAFVVDDSVWTTDPRSPIERDPDYGRNHSIIVVGRP